MEFNPRTVSPFSWVMSRNDPRPDTRRAAKEAVDPALAEEVLNRADENLYPGSNAAEALREAAADETIKIAEEAADLARRRGSETIEIDDVAHASERHQEREERTS